MKPKKAVSLLLAAQLLSAPLAQAAPLSSRSAAALNGQSGPSAFQRLRLSSAASGASNREETPAAPGRLIAPTTEVTATLTPQATLTPAPGVTVPPIPQATLTPTPEATVTPIPEATAIPAPEVTATPAPEATLTPAPEVTATPAPEATLTPAPEVTATPAPEATLTPIPEATATPAPEVTATPIPEATATPTPEATMMPTPEMTPPASDPISGNLLSPPETEAVLQTNALEQGIAPLADLSGSMDGYTRLYLGFGYESLKADVVGNNGRKGDQGSFGQIAVEKEADPAEWEKTTEDGFNSFLQYGGRIYDGPIRGWITSDVDDYDYSGDSYWQPRADGHYYLEDLPVAVIIPGETMFDDPTVEYIKLTQAYTEEMLGRVPDYEFDAWNVYGYSSYSRRGIIWRTLFHDRTVYPGGIEHEDIKSVDKVPILPSDWDTPVPYGEPVDVAALKTAIPTDASIRKPSMVEDGTTENMYFPLGYYGPQYVHYPEDGGELPLLAYWKLSGRAELVDEAKLNPEFDATKATTRTALYAVTPDGVTTTDNILSQSMWSSPDMTGTPTPFDYKESGEYWLGVPSSTTAIDPNLIAYEAYRSAEITGTTGITIRARGAGETTWTDYTVQHAVLNDSEAMKNGDGSPATGTIDGVDDQPLYRLKNSTEYPMRSQWTLTNGTIPLEETTVASPFNDLEITLTSPDGSTTRTYTFHIRRLGDPKAELNPGNTPYGMIARDTSDTWGSTEEERAANKAQAKADFVANGYSFAGLLYYPWDAANNSGNYAGANRSLTYHPSAWLLPEGYDPDLDETAIVVYQDSSFVDPGLTVYDTLGNPVDLTTGSVKRSVVLRLADDPATGALTTKDLYTWDERGQYYYRGLHDMPKAEENVDTFQVITEPDGRSRIDLRGQKVIPGVYTMEYSLTDPMSGTVYSSTSDNYVDPTRADGFRRTLVILPVPGDVDMDGAVTPADGEVLRRAFGTGVYDDKFLTDMGTDPTVALFAHRVCDVDNDGAVNGLGVDAQRIREGYSPEFSATRCDYFYLPLPDGMTDGERQEWRKRLPLQPVAPDAPKDPDDKRGKLSLEYLGVHEPEVVNTATLDTFQANADVTKGVSVGDIFWVGVRVSDIKTLVQESASAPRQEKKAIAGGLAALSMSIAYDGRYVEPAILKGSWEATIRDYNIVPEGTVAGATTWPSDYVVTAGTHSGDDYTVHYSRPIAPLETTEGAELKELTVALNRRDNSSSARVLNRDGQGQDEYYLLRIPFKLNRVPKDATTLSALEMSLGMKGVALFSQLVPQQDIEVPQVSVCWSTQPIFGDNTRNLADELIYVDGSARSIPLGEDTTPTTDLVNKAPGSDGKTVYGEEYVNRDLDVDYTGRLPAGLTKDSGTGDITGRPTEVGTFVLEHANGSRYRITVEKAPLTLTVTPQERYYGEPNGEFVYTYDVTQIKNADLPGGANYVAGFVNDGSMGMLEKLPGFRAPERTTTVTQDTGAGDYKIHISDAPVQAGDNDPLTNYGSGAANYRFVYRNGDGSGTPATEADSKLAVLPRPLLVDKVPQSGVSVYVTDPTKVFEGQEASYENSGSQEYVLVDLKTHGDYTGKLTGTPVYSTDQVKLTFTVELKDADRNPQSPWYTVPEGDASRAVGAYVYDLAISGPSAANYTLINRRTNGSVMPQDNEAEATAIASRVEGLQVKNAPSLDYDYGSTFRVYGLQVVLSRSDGRDSEYNYINDASEATYTAQKIQFTWEEDKTSLHRDDPAHKLSNGLILDYDTHNGRYFCVSVPGYDADGNPKMFTWYSEEPMTVRKAPLTITVVPKTVYYGEYGTANDPALTFTYNVGELTLEDQNALLAQFPDRTALRGTQEELEKLEGYHAPLMEAWTGPYGTTEKIDENTSVGRYSIWIYNDVDAHDRVLSGAKNYSFYYTRGVDRDPNLGMGVLQIQRRPIVVDRVVLGSASQAFVYDDTRSLELSRMYYRDAQGNMVPNTLTLSGVNGNAGADTFVATIPTAYIGAGSAAVAPANLLTGTAIHTNTYTHTLDTVVLTYRATYVPDPGKEQSVPPASTYFDLPAGQTTKLADVKIDQLALSTGAGTHNSNYILVYAHNNTLATQRPEDDRAQGRVELRPIETLAVSAPPSQLTYTYGDQIDLSGMTLQMHYRSEGDNSYDLNQAGVIERSLANVRVEEGDNFQLQGLKVYWVDAGEDWTGLTQAQLAQKAASLQSAHRGSYPDVARTGKKLVVLGRRADAHQWVWGMMEDEDTYTIRKKSLPLRVGDLNRFYAEQNATAQRPYQASFFAGDLAEPDRDKLSAAGLLTGENQGSLTAPSADLSLSTPAAEVSIEAVSPALSLLNADYESDQTTKYIGPRFTTPGTRESEVGRYEIGLDLTGSQMANYVFTQVGTGQLRLFRRPIEIGKVTQDPIMTIYVTTPATVYPAYAESSWTDTDGTVKQGFTVQLPHLRDDGTYESRDPEVIAAANSGIEFNMPLTGSGLWGSDILGLNMSVTYPVVGNREELPESAREVKQPVTISRLSLSGETARNYYLVSSSTPNDRNAMAALDRRSIREIRRIITPPKMSYTYGEALDLSDLEVEVVFDRITVGDQAEPETTATLRANDLLGRLAVNYWDSPNLPDDREAGFSQRQAQSGDHLTIAPLHDGSGFAHDGKYLILTARAHASTEPAAPVLVYTNLATQQPTPLAVEPLDLQYELTAQGKVYDGTTVTQGAITLTNPYVDERQEEPGESPDRDLIYVVTGGEALSDSDLAQAVNDPDKTLGEVYHYESGTEGLTFRFFDPNVVYYEGEYTSDAPVAPADWQSYWDALAPKPETPGDPGWDGYESLEVAPMPVLVSGLALAGPDAANYRLDPQVELADNADPAAGKDPVPYAAIEKAQREIAWTEEPRVSVDHHTNVVHVSYDTPIDDLLTQVLPDQYHRELHYEYALEYQPEGEDDPTLDPDTGLTLWGGESPWTDAPYFGGERTDRGAVLASGSNGGQVYSWLSADPGFGSREPLKRDTVYWGVVRLAATRNYEASEWIASTTPEEAPRDAENARAMAAQVTGKIESWTENGQEPKEGEDVELAQPSAAAIKTYAQSYTVVAVTRDRSGDRETIQETLDAVWFSDIQHFREQDLLEAVLRNQVTKRYYNYYWDPGQSASLRFDNGGLDLTAPLTVEVEERQSDGSTVKKTVVVNENASAYLYTSTQGGGGGGNFASDIGFGGLGGGGGEGSGGGETYVVGGAPVKLQVELKPYNSRYEGLDWTTSDPRVVLVDETGTLYFVGVGTAEITATTRLTHKTAKITITVTDPTGVQQGVGVAWETSLTLSASPENHFDFYYSEPLFTLDGEDTDGEYLFHPRRLMTRGELVGILSRFYIPREEALWTGETPFWDLTGEEEYAGAVELLYSHGIINGLPDGSFGGEKIVTRSEIAAILCRLMGLTPATRAECVTFVDYGQMENEWSDGYVEALARAGVVLGTGEGYFNPGRELTREETAAMLGRLLLSGVYYGPNALPLIPSDVTEKHWGYSLILRAVNRVTARMK